ncbi:MULTISPECIES: HtaA domain-containing protein [Streptomyces]|uniref:Htaa domain protein n=1 Tax=Streptomyces venezuelae TaxID=54571 RepID=A0A5P2B8M5_STRVZ|nr:MULTISPECIES: HtaA domain-containing protein [Streptomyces]NEA04338.1 Htaa domain protein [Streptomyces sp. SID10116]MYY83061.1 Htaa domain protein [Streptomyces sp. SID335]MYZ15202.1 Htaa domain protein [Streptomyces sp. SID337]NDZ86673.1 Htaa domain protein [Streptomyces sp. SID10115]NEB47227.1 Htaa domain protein [Streptomyces sp. SID339]
MPSSGQARAIRRAGTVAALAALTGALLPVATARADDRTVRGGRLDWGIKSSFQSYVTGPIAHGASTLQGGAATVGGSRFRFHSAKGSYDPDSGTFTAGFSGGVRFTGHKKGGSYELDLTISRPTVKVSGGSGTLYADMVSKQKGTGKITSTPRVPLASLNVSGIDMKGGTGPIALDNIPATLTSQGAEAFAGYYTAGTALDPVSLSTDLVTKSAPKSEPEQAPSRRAATSGEKAGRIENAAVDWGVRRTFREYVTGPIAKGEWKLSAGAQDGGALFRFPKGEGTYDEKKHTLAADFAGSVRFTGAHGLDLTLAGITVDVRDGKGTLSADVVSKGDRGTTLKDAPLVTFPAAEKELKPEDGLVSLTEVPSKLTAEGAEAFGGMYKAGSSMDPLSLAVALDTQAKLPALPDLGSSAAPEPAPEKHARPKTENAADSADSSSNAVPIGVGAGVAVLLAAAVALGFVRKRRGSTGTDTPPADAS